MITSFDAFNEMILEKKSRKKTKSRKGVFLPLDIGDTILTGRYRNKEVEVKTIGKDEKGQPTVNGRPILNCRIKKLIPKPKVVEND